VSHDLIITNRSAEKHSYIIAAGEQNPVIHTKNAPNVPINSGSSTPTQAGGVYDLRDTEGDKAITHLDWTLGSGQKSLDVVDAHASRFWESSCLDVSRPGELRLLRAGESTHLENTVGPVYSALGYLWMGDARGYLKYSSDNGANWTTCTGYTPTAPISGFATDGTKLFVAIPSGAANSIYVNTAAAIGTFAKFGDTGTTVAVRHLAYASGVLFAATTSYVAMVNATTGVVSTTSAQKTPDFLNTTMTSVALVTAGNSVYWVVSQGGRSYVYVLTMDDALTTMYTQQYAELPDGFVATCALGYLSTVYIGGYYQSATVGVGKGTVYRCDDGLTSPLFELGEYPELTSAPDSSNNDNRIWAICSASKDLYVLTNRACWRWDIDGTGYSHIFDFPGTGSAEMLTSWNAGSTFSWDGTDGANGAPSYQFPVGFTEITETRFNGAVTEHPGTWSYTDGVAVYSDPGGESVKTTVKGYPHDNGETLSNDAGTTLQIVFRGSSCYYYWELGTAAGSFYVYLNDGTRQARLAVLGQASSFDNFYPKTDTNIKINLQQWNGSAWESGLTYPSIIAGTSDTVTFTLRGITATAKITSASGASSALLTTNLTKADTSHDSIEFVWPAYRTYLSAKIQYAIDSWTLNSVGAASSAFVTDALFRPSIAHCKGNLMAPYAEASGNKTLTITGHTVANPTIITTSEEHGIEAGGTQVVNISGSSSTPTIDGNHLATRIDATRFSVPVDVASGARNVGTVSYNHLTGYSKTTTGLAPAGWLTQSLTSFHSGSILKDFRMVDVVHEPLPAGATVSITWEIDGVGGSAAAVTDGGHTTFVVNQRGYSIGTTLSLTYDATMTVSPVVKSVNVIWNFVKTKKHQYLLDCRTGAGGGRWDEDSEEAIAFLFSTADEQATFEDRFIGSYEGTVEEVQFAQANYSAKEGYGGLVRVTVREAS
jgi:hypothetical protein